MHVKRSHLGVLVAVVLSGVGFSIAGRGGAPIEAEQARDLGVVAAEPELPGTLRATGLYADWPSRTVAPEHRPFSPQYPLWSDGAEKARWIHLPAGTVIDASQPDAWQLPVGTRLWKEFSFQGRPVETRYMERTASGWRYASYAWNEAGTEATLAPGAGVAAAVEIAPGTWHAIPSQSECRACHANGPTPVLGFSGLQLSTDRDPGALHAEPPPAGALDLAALHAEERIVGWPGSSAPRIEGRSQTERTALGYLHANCGSCHRPGSPITSNGLVLAHSVTLEGAAAAPALATTQLRPSHFSLPGAGEAARVRIMPGDPTGSVLWARVRSRDPVAQMPPMGTKIVDEQAVELLARWIEELSTRTGERT